MEIAALSHVSIRARRALDHSGRRPTCMAASLDPPCPLRFQAAAAVASSVMIMEWSLIILVDTVLFICSLRTDEVGTRAHVGSYARQASSDTSQVLRAPSKVARPV
jgi:hypothetical protein